MQHFKWILLGLLLAGLMFPASSLWGQKNIKDGKKTISKQNIKSKLSDKIKKIKNPITKAKKGDWANYKVLISSPMTSEPMKSKLELKVLAVRKKTVKIYFYTNLMGQVRKQVKVIPKKATLVSALLSILTSQLRLKAKLEKAKLLYGQLKVDGKKVKCAIVDAKISGISPSGQRANNTMKIWIHKSVAVFGMAKAEVQTEWKLGDTKMKLTVSILLTGHSKAPKKAPKAK